MTRGRQGKKRTITREAALCLAIALALHESAELPVESALATAHALMRSPDGTIQWLPARLSVQASLAAWRADLAEALDAANLRSVVTPRGRPPRRPRRMLDR
ncbi:MAG: hypothetical protein HY275_12400 [Gemmatimonadetes bacterium]|nr:hypothetical protein [Gemmatimonadota bacterium]